MIGGFFSTSSYILFSILPTICDIVIAIVYFVSYFSVWFGLIVFTCMVLYLSECQSVFDCKVSVSGDPDLGLAEIENIG